MVRLCNTQDCHSMRGRFPPRSPRRGTLPWPADSAAPCSYSEGSFVFITLWRGHWGSPKHSYRHGLLTVKFVILITVNVINCYYTNIINILFFKHPLWKFLSRLLKTLCIPLGEIRTQRSCDCNKQGRCFRQAASPIKTMACTLVHHNSLIQPAVTHASVHNTDK